MHAGTLQFCQGLEQVTLLHKTTGAVRFTYLTTSHVHPNFQTKTATAQAPPPMTEQHLRRRTGSGTVVYSDRFQHRQLRRRWVTERSWNPQQGLDTTSASALASPQASRYHPHHSPLLMRIEVTRHLGNWQRPLPLSWVRAANHEIPTPSSRRHCSLHPQRWAWQHSVHEASASSRAKEPLACSQ